MLELELRIKRALEAELLKHSQNALLAPGNQPSLYDYGFACGVAAGMSKAIDVVRSAISSDEEEDDHGRIRRGGLPG